jgi:hypothetical protein
MTVVVTATSVVSMVPVSLGGLGIREGSYLYFLSMLGIQRHVGMAFGVSILAVNLSISLAGGLLLYLCKATGRV